MVQPKTEIPVNIDGLILELNGKLALIAQWYKLLADNVNLLNKQIEDLKKASVETETPSESA